MKKLKTTGILSSGRNSGTLTKGIPSSGKKVYQRSVSKQFLLFALLFCTFLLVSCVSVAPVNTSFESASTLGKGHVELMGAYSTYSVRYAEYEGDKESEKLNNNYGFRFGVGVSDRVDLKFRYERLIPAIAEERENVSGVNYMAFTTRVSFWKKYITGSWDIGQYMYKAEDNMNYDENLAEHIFFFSNRIAFTYPSGKYFDLTLTNKFDFYPFEGAVMVGWNLGCGLSSNLDNWALRPEIGIMQNISEASNTFFTGGVALIVNLPSNKSSGKP